SRVTVAADGTQAASPVAAVPLTRPSPGPRLGHRPARRAAAAGPGAWPRAAEPAAAVVDRAAGMPRPRWRLRLPGSVQAGIAVAGSVQAGIAVAGSVQAGIAAADGSVAGEVVVAASTSGDVAAVRVPADHGERGVSWLWRARFGPVYRRPGVSRDG